MTQFRNVVQSVLLVQKNYEDLIPLAIKLNEINHADLTDIVKKIITALNSFHRYLREYTDFPQSVAKFIELEQNQQSKVKSIVNDKKLYIENNRLIKELIAAIGEIAIEDEAITALLKSINVILNNLDESLDIYSAAANELLLAATTSITPVVKKDQTKWIRSTGRNNLCGFASFVLPLNSIILNTPWLFYTDGNVPRVTKKFIKLYMEELALNKEQLIELSKNPNELEVQTICAPALKRAFARTILNDNSNESPFNGIFEMLIGEYLAPDADDVREYINQNRALLNATRAEYKNMVNAQVDADDTIVGEVAKAQAKADSYDYIPGFINFVIEHKPEYVAAAKAKYWQSGIIDIILGEFSEPGSYGLNDYADYTKEFINANRALLDTAHAAYKLIIDAQVDADDSVIGDEAKTNLKINRYEDGVRFLKYIANTNPEFIVAAKANYSQKLMLPNDKYMNRETDMLYIAAQLGLKSLTNDNGIGAIGFNTTFLNSATGKANIKIRHRALHWEAASLLQFEPEVIASAETLRKRSIAKTKIILT